MSRDHRRLDAFRHADEVVTRIYEATRKFPREELFGFTSQMRRSAVSVAANIVEGCARRTQQDYVHFLTIALASARELGYYIHLSRRLGYLSSATYDDLEAQHEQATRLLGALIKSLR